MDSSGLRLSDILGRIAIDAYEAVAFVRAVAEHVSEQHGAWGVPDLHQIQLAHDGRISLSGTVRTSDPVKRLGQLLQAALVRADPPVQLRLRASEATGPMPVYGSVLEYSYALAYFERPDRASVLQAVYARAVDAPPARDLFEPTLDALAPVPEPTKEVQPKKARRPTSARATVSVVALAVTAGGAAAYLQVSGGVPSQLEVSEVAGAASDLVAGAVLSGVSSVTETVGLGRLVPTAGSAVPVPQASAPSSGPARAAGPRRASEPSVVLGSTRSTPLPGMRIFDLPGVRAALPEIQAEADVTTMSVTIRAVGDGPIYSASDADVHEPVGVHPRFPTVLPADVQHLTQVELVVLPDGSVGSVKLLGAPRSVIETMLLSAAKAWTFTPGRKDGNPVTYRKIVWLAIE